MCFPSKFFLTRSSSQTKFGNGLTRLVRIEGADFSDKKKTFDFVLELIEQSKSKKQIVMFTPGRLAIQMPASNERALASAEILDMLKTAIHTQLFGLTLTSERLPIRINFHQKGGRITFLNPLMSSGQVTWP